MSHNGTDVAAAQVFKVTEDVAQVIYWGDLRQYASLRTMNFLAYKVFKYYYQKASGFSTSARRPKTGCPTTVSATLRRP